MVMWVAPTGARAAVESESWCRVSWSEWGVGLAFLELCTECGARATSSTRRVRIFLAGAGALRCFLLKILDPRPQLLRPITKPRGRQKKIDGPAAGCLAFCLCLSLSLDFSVSESTIALSPCMAFFVVFLVAFYYHAIKTF
jgi:hypothetical protein